MVAIVGSAADGSIGSGWEVADRATDSYSEIDCATWTSSLGPPGTGAELIGIAYRHSVDLWPELAATKELEEVSLLFNQLGLVQGPVESMAPAAGAADR